MTTKALDWLEKAVFYQIYPQSFQDTNGDGIGDIQGIINRLDYIQQLGCNALWINPCFVSPFQDAGYDVADYYQVAPRYGSNNDLIRLFNEAHKRDIRVCLDLVPGHTSIEHPWFKKSSQPEKNEYSNYYIWTDSVWDEGGVGLKTINGLSNRDGNYLINFFYCQPALNFGFAKPDPDKPWQLSVNHPDVLRVRDEIKNIMRYWLDLGADGFRVDMASSLVKNDDDKEETIKFWNEVRAMLERDYPEAALIAEWSYPTQAIKAGFHVDFMIHFNTEAYTALLRNENERNLYKTAEPRHSFFDKEGKGDIREFLDEYLMHYQAIKGDGYISIPTGNHDLPRMSVERTDKELELIFAFVLTMPGIPFIYYGDEIGMRYLRELVSKEGGYNRTGARTPMQWNDKVNAGFSTAPPEKLYLPVDSHSDFPNVEMQKKESNSLLNQVKKLIKLRLENQALLADGEFKPLYAKKESYPLIYERSSAEQRFIIVINPAAEEKEALVEGELMTAKLKLVFSHGIKFNQKRHGLQISAAGTSYGIFQFYR